MRPLLPFALRAPELATLAVLDTALAAAEHALQVACPELHCGVIERPPRAATVARASATIVQVRRLATAIAAYRDAVEREARGVYRAQRFL